MSGEQIDSQNASITVDKIKQVAEGRDLIYDNPSFALPYFIGKKIKRIPIDPSLTDLSNGAERTFRFDKHSLIGDVSLSGTLGAPSSGGFPDGVGFNVIRDFSLMVGGRELYKALYMPAMKALLYNLTVHERSNLVVQAGGDPSTTESITFTVPVPLMNHSLWYNGKGKYIPNFLYNGETKLKLNFRTADNYDGGATYDGTVSGFQLNISYLDVSPDVKRLFHSNRSKWFMKGIIPQGVENITGTDDAITSIIDINRFKGEIRYFVVSVYDSGNALDQNTAAPYAQQTPDILRLRGNNHVLYEALSSTEVENDTQLINGYSKNDGQVVIAGATIGGFSGHPYIISFDIGNREHSLWQGSINVDVYNQLILEIDADTNNAPHYDITAITEAIMFIDHQNVLQLIY